MKRLISRDRSIIPACDVDFGRFQELIRTTCDIDAVGAYKIGFSLALSVGLPRVVEVARKYTNKPLIYDHQKAGTDIPETAGIFARILKEARVDAVILFPMAGPETQKAFIKSCVDLQLPVLVGAHMTHAKYLYSKGGYIADEAVEMIYDLSKQMGVTDYVVPGNKPDVIRTIRQRLEGTIQPVFYAPGFISQGGKITEAAAAAGPRWHAIVGRAIFEQPDMYQATVALTTDF